MEVLGSHVHFPSRWYAHWEGNCKQYGKDGAPLFVMTSVLILLPAPNTHTRTPRF